MMGHFGFSYVGLLFLLALMIPNLLWIKRQPQGYSADGENRVLCLLERIGEVAVSTCAVIFSDYNPHGWSWWLAATVVLMLLYELWWVRYFRSERTMTDFYSSFCGVPVAGATLPVLAFICLGMYGRVIWMLISCVILGVGHIGVHWQHSRQVKNNP